MVKKISGWFDFNTPSTSGLTSRQNQRENQVASGPGIFVSKDISANQGFCPEQKTVYDKL